MLVRILSALCLVSSMLIVAENVRRNFGSWRRGEASGLSHARLFCLVAALVLLAGPVWINFQAAIINSYSSIKVEPR